MSASFDQPDETRGPAEASAPRAGRLACFCPPGVPVEGAEAIDLPDAKWGTALLAGGFALSVLSQTLVLGLVPLAGSLMAPTANLVTAPYIAMLIGAAAATFPASFLLDAFGRRAAFALGASTGVAGGFVMAWALVANAFIPFCLGAFWLGIAQGFSLFYRHEAALGSGGQGRAMAIGVVFGAGTLAGLAGPALAVAAQAFFPESLFVGAALAAAISQVAVLALAVVSAGRAPVVAKPLGAARLAPAPTDWRAFAAPTFIAAVAWFAMTAQMVATPAAMAACGIPVGSVLNAVAWHVIAMYAPAFVAGAVAKLTGARTLALLGLAAIVVARYVSSQASGYLGFTAGLILVAVGWSLSTAAATMWLHREARPTRVALAAHDGLLFLAAILGAAAAIAPLGAR
jgi:MFS family permease